MSLLQASKEENLQKAVIKVNEAAKKGSTN
jgi:hypothetical protein